MTGSLPDSEHDLYRCSPMIRGTLGSSADLVYLPLSQVARLLTPADGRVLRACQTFRTLDEHAKHIQCELLPAGSAVDIRRRLEFLASQGGLISRREILEACSGLPPT